MVHAERITLFNHINVNLIPAATVGRAGQAGKAFRKYGSAS